MNINTLAVKIVSVSVFKAQTTPLKYRNVFRMFSKLILSSKLRLLVSVSQNLKSPFTCKVDIKTNDKQNG